MELISVNKAAEILVNNGKIKTMKLAKQNLYKAIRRHQFDVFGNTTILLDQAQVEDYMNGEISKKEVFSPLRNMELDFDESIRFIESFHNPNSIKQPLKYRSRCLYGVTNKGRVFDLTYHRQLSQCKAAHDYWQTTMCLNGKKKDERVHVLVAYVWCPNGKLKKEIHHIDGNRFNNHSNNLIWVTPKEHKKAEKIMTEAKDSGEWDEYNQFIADIQKDNEWVEEYRAIAFDKPNAIIFVWIPKDTYEDYKSGKRSLKEISTDEVLAERIVRKEEKR